MNHHPKSHDRRVARHRRRRRSLLKAPVMHQPRVHYAEHSSPSLSSPPPPLLQQLQRSANLWFIKLARTETLTVGDSARGFRLKKTDRESSPRVVRAPHRARPLIFAIGVITFNREKEESYEAENGKAAGGYSSSRVPEECSWC